MHSFRCYISAVQATGRGLRYYTDANRTDQRATGLRPSSSGPSRALQWICRHPVKLSRLSLALATSKVAPARYCEHRDATRLVALGRLHRDAELPH